MTVVFTLYNKISDSNLIRLDHFWSWKKWWEINEPGEQPIELLCIFIKNQNIFYLPGCKNSDETDDAKNRPLIRSLSYSLLFSFFYPRFEDCLSLSYFLSPFYLNMNTTVMHPFVSSLFYQHSYYFSPQHNIFLSQSLSAESFKTNSFYYFISHSFFCP